MSCHYDYPLWRINTKGRTGAMQVPSFSTYRKRDAREIHCHSHHCVPYGVPLTNVAWLHEGRFLTSCTSPTRFSNVKSPSSCLCNTACSVAVAIHYNSNSDSRKTAFTSIRILKSQIRGSPRRQAQISRVWRSSRLKTTLCQHFRLFDYPDQVLAAGFIDGLHVYQ